MFYIHLFLLVLLFVVVVLLFEISARVMSLYDAITYLENECHHHLKARCILSSRLDEMEKGEEG